VILTGDFNIAHQEIDLARPKENEGTAGFLPQEREWMTHFLNSGWTDSFRYLHPDARDAYSWWSMRMRARERNVGWRIDYHAVPSADRDRIKGAAIHADVKGSDHCPVSLDFEADLA
jgi:exodeoxyribonuclease-3